MKTTINPLLRLRAALVVLLCMLSAIPSFADSGFTIASDGTKYRIKCVYDWNGSSALYLYDNNGTLRGTDYASDATSDAAKLQMWTFEPVETGNTGSGYYYVKNVSTNRYLVPVSSQNEVATASETQTQVYLSYSETADNWNILSSADNTISYNYQGGEIKGWAAHNGSNTEKTNSEWTFIVVPTSVSEFPFQADATPEASADKLYRIVNKQYSTYAIAENTSNGVTTLDYTSATDLSQLWYLESTSDGKMSLRNALTGNYIQSLSGTKNSQYKTGSEAYGFTIATNSSNASYYDIRDTDALGFNATDKNQGTTNAGGSSSKGDIYSWTFFDGTNDNNSLWSFQSVTLTEAIKSTVSTAKSNYEKEKALAAILSNGKVRIKTRRSDGYYISDESSKLSVAAGKETSDDDYNSQVWIIEASGNQYTLRNLKTGNYLSYNTASTSAKKFYIAYNEDNTDSESYVNIYESKASTSGAIHYQTNGNVVVSWGADAGEGSDWELESVDITDAVVRAAFDKMEGVLSAVPTDGSYVKVKSVKYGQVFDEEMSKDMSHTTNRSKDAYQLWKFEAVEGSDGYFQIKNALTGEYICNTTGWNSRVTAQTDAQSGGFKVALVDSRFHSSFTIAQSGNPGYALHAQSGGALVIWTTNAEASQWTLLASDMNDEEIAAQKTNLNTIATDISNAATDYTALQTFFSDALCTKVKDEYASLSDDEFTTQLTNAGVTSATLRTLALKAKNSTWSKWEKTFRVRKAEPYANPDTWESILKIGNRYTNLTNPTGIWAEPYKVQYVFVGTDIPEGATLKLKSVPSAANQGYEVATLTKGLNAFYVNKEGAYYIDYVVETSDADNSKKLADYATLDIRIEGGTVDGYFDATIDEIGTNSAWTQMNTDGLFQKGFIALKGTRFTFQYFTDWAKEVFNETGHVRELVDFWDWMLRLYHKEMGIDDYYDRWNCLDGFYHVNSGLYATTYGIYYADKNILNYDDLVSGKGDLWGPAHETGHNHQALINLIGTTEISNNLFSQIAVHRNGVTSTRLNGMKFHDVANYFAANKSWHDYDIWSRNTLYLKLYLYYEVAGYKPTFIRDLFTALRKDPCTKGTDENNPTPASDDFLKFAVKCCDVAQEDLSEFFEAYGFFVPFEKRCIGDYANYWTYCTEDMINDAKAKMKAYSKPKGNILFIENHIKYEPAQDHDGNYLYDESGNQILRKDYSDEDAVGKCGDIGSYSDYAIGNYADGYSYTVDNDTVIMAGTGGAVGYKVYDSEGNLLYFANENKFTLPESVVTKLGGDLSTMVVKAAQPDGSDVTLPNPNATVYTLKVYHANALTSDKSNTVYTDGTASTLPVLEDNALAFIQPSTAKAALPEALTQAQNVVDATNEAAPVAYNVVLTDKADYYTPSSFTATTLTYSRSNTEGWNSVCLPFAVTAEDFGTDARLETLTALTETDGTVTLHFNTPAAAPEAGTPCLVYCPEGTDSWTLNKTNTTLVANPVSTTVDGYSLNGSFVNATIGAGHYKLNAAGNAMGVTTDAGLVTAFRCYVSPLSSAASIRSLAVHHGEGTVSAVGNVQTASPASASFYDLTGRKVAKPVKGGLYIVNGRKVIVK